MKTAKATNIDEYISRFHEITQRILEQLRDAIRSAAPNADEVIKNKIR